jgi:hypothetical protein
MAGAGRRLSGPGFFLFFLFAIMTISKMQQMSPRVPRTTPMIMALVVSSSERPSAAPKD